MPPTIRHARKKVILSPVHWHTGTVCFHRSGVISCYKIDGLFIRTQKKSMHAVVTPCLHAPKFFHFIKLIVSVGVRKSVDTALHLLLVIVHCNIQAIKSPKQSIGSTDFGWDFFDVTFLKGLSFCWYLETIKTAKLIAGNDTILVIEA